MNQQNQLFVAVFADGGIITTVSLGSNLKSLVLNMMTQCDERFDSQTDDARIFDAAGNEVYVFPTPGDLGLGVYFCPECAEKTERVEVQEHVFCACGNEMERLDVGVQFYIGYTQSDSFLMDKSQLVNFIMEYSDEELKITDTLDRMVATKLPGGFLNRVYDGELHKYLMSALVPVQQGEVGAKPFEPIQGGRRHA
ncbi:hypothetical protein [Alicyclobacillus fodiniaquatilis]|uniref:Uncharacterized protein n=1 Tax=Alicyclobacillus fodiniaquatilis TaxID=1661150 RepID=A0ABW4JJY4_9BACL